MRDGGGEFAAARHPIVGRDRVARLYLKLAEKRDPEARYEIRLPNGLPAVIAEFPRPRPGEPRCFVIGIELDAHGRVRAVYSILPPRKLTALPS